MSDILSAARAAASVGWRVFPTREKAPLIPAWKDNATLHPDSLDWSQADGYGIALPPGVVVLDLDTDETGSLQPAREQVADFLTWLNRFNTVVVKTRNGGRHVYVQTDTTGLRQTKLGRNVDLRVGGLGYVIGPGSPGYRIVVGGPALPAPISLPFVWLGAPAV
jgi:hypothetical protein